MTAALPSPAHVLSDRAHYLPIGVGASVLQALLMVPGYHDDGSFQTGEWLVILGISLVLTVAVFAFVVPRGGSTTAIVLGAVALLASVPFWMMLSLPLAVGAAVVGLRARHDVAERTRGTVGVALAAVAAAASLAFIIGDMIAGD
jgi:hypothetical protein